MIKIKEGFKGERFASLPDDILQEYSHNPLIRNLYIRKIGFFPHVKYHYVQKEKGCDYGMLIYCTGGKGWYKIEEKTYEIKENQYIVIPPNIPYSFGADDSDPWTIYWIHFKGALTEQFIPKSHAPKNILPGDYSRLQDRLDLFEEIYNSFSMGYTLENMIYASMCLYQFLASFLYLDQYRSINLPTHKEYLLLSARAVHYMQENIHQNLSLEQIASYFKYSTSHFCTLFQKETGVSPINYFIRLKMQKACQYLEMTNRKINEVAASLGFEEPAYFTKMFTKMIGITPSQYRKRESAVHRGEIK